MKLASALSALLIAIAATVVLGSTPATAAPVRPPVITNADTTYGKLNKPIIVVGTAAPGATVVLHFHRAGTASSNYSIVRTVKANSAGKWSKSFILNPDYRVFATVGSGNPHSKTALFTSATAPPNPTALGGTQNVKADFGNTIVGVQFKAINGAAKSDNPYITPSAGHRFVSVGVCVRNRGPKAFDDAAANDFTLDITTGGSFQPNYATVKDGPPLDLGHMAVKVLRCGEVVFELPIKSNVKRLRFTPDSGYGTTTLRWSTP